jgi:hypothetical protein
LKALLVPAIAIGAETPSPMFIARIRAWRPAPSNRAGMKPSLNGCATQPQLRAISANKP